MPAGPDRLAVAREIAELYAASPVVTAVALGGSGATGFADGRSDIDLYVYAEGETPLDHRAAVLAARAVRGEAEFDNRTFEPGDEWLDRSGVAVDVMHRDVGWIEDRLAAVLDRAEASLGYTTCLVHNVATSRTLYARDGWWEGLRAKAAGPYPEPLAAAILALNGPMLRDARCSFLRQLEDAAARGDEVAARHRTTAFLASAFDVLFAANRRLHPGEKRLLEHVRRGRLRTPEGFEADVLGLLRAPPADAPGHARRVADGLLALAGGA